MPRVFAPIVLGSIALLGCRDRDAAEHRKAGDAASDSAAPGLRSAWPLPDVREHELPDPIGGSAPSLSVVGEGPTLVWMRDLGEPSVMLSSWADAEWSEPQTVVASPRLLVNWADVPTAGETSSGRLVVAWPEHHTDDPAAGYGIRVAAALDDGSFGPAWSPDEVRRGPESGFVGFVGTPEGLRMFWLDGRDLGGHGHGHASRGTMRLRSVLIDEAGHQQGPSELLDERTCECCKLGVGLLGAQAFAAYRDRSDAEIRDIFVAGPKLAPSPVAADGWTIAGCPVNGPAVASAGDRAYVAWFTGADDHSATWIAGTRSLAAFERPQRFDLGLPGGRVDLLALPDGDALISWLELDPKNPGLAALLTRRLSADGQLGEPFAVAELGAARDWGFPRAALLGDGVLWVYTDPTALDGRPRLRAVVGGLPPC